MLDVATIKARAAARLAAQPTPSARFASVASPANWLTALAPISQLATLASNDEAQQGTGDPDRWCWPHSDAMNTEELDAMQLRLVEFARRGIGEVPAAEKPTATRAPSLARARAGNQWHDLADLLLVRDRQQDDRRLCIECTHLGERGRCLAAAAGRLAGTDRHHEPVQTILQRCPAFRLQKGLV